MLTGTGEKAFCAGMDLRAFAEGGALGGDPEGMKGFTRFAQGEIGDSRRRGGQRHGGGGRLRAPAGV